MARLLLTTSLSLLALTGTAWAQNAAAPPPSPPGTTPAVATPTPAPAAQPAKAPVAVAAPAQPAPPPAATTKIPPPSAPSPVDELTTLRRGLESDLKAARSRWEAVQPEANGLLTLNPSLRAAAIDFTVVRNGLQACIGSPALDACHGEPITKLRTYAQSLEPALRDELLQRLTAVDAVRKELSELVVLVRGLQDRSLEARQEAERLVQAAYHQARDMDENPLEAAPVKARAIKGWRDSVAERDRVAAVAQDVERKVRPMEGQIAGLRGRLVEGLGLFGGP